MAHGKKIDLDTLSPEERERVALEKDAARWREFSKGEPLTVKMKKSTVVFGPNPERA